MLSCKILFIIFQLLPPIENKCQRFCANLVLIYATLFSYELSTFHLAGTTRWTLKELSQNSKIKHMEDHCVTGPHGLRIFSISNLSVLRIFSISNLSVFKSTFDAISLNGYLLMASGKIMLLCSVYPTTWRITVSPVLRSPYWTYTTSLWRSLNWIPEFREQDVRLVEQEHWTWSFARTKQDVLVDLEDKYAPAGPAATGP
jgi:hypothetical protein